MATAEQNEETLKDLFSNFGPGHDHWMQAYNRYLTDDCKWYMQGWPTVLGIQELEYQLHILRALLVVDANPILEWREIHNYGDKLFFERKGSFADVDGNIITNWDIFGVIYFNEDGKIYEIRDYFDNTGPYSKLEGVIPDEQIRMINQLAVNPLDANYQPNPTFYKDMWEQLQSSGAAA